MERGAESIGGRRRKPSVGTSGGRRPKRRPKRRRRVLVRVETDGEAYTGTVALGRRLSELLNDDRTYLAVWDARLEGTGETEEFVAIHKGAIRSVAVVEERPRLVSGS